MHVDGGMCFEEFASRLRKSCTSQKASFFFRHGGSSFVHCVFYHLLHVQKNHKNGTRNPFPSFWKAKMGPRALLRIREAHFGQAGVLSLSVVPSVSVEGAMECQLRVNDVFCAVCLCAARCGLPSLCNSK